MARLATGLAETQVASAGRWSTASPARTTGLEHLTGSRLRTLAPAGLAECAAALWLRSLASIDVRGASDLGLVSVVPPAFIVAFVLLTAGYCLALRQAPVSVPLLLLHLVVLVLMLYGTLAIVEDEPRYHPEWRLVGISDYIMRHGAVDPTLDAFFNWPGFFILSAFVTQAAGLESPLAFAAWAPFAFNLMYLGPLVMLFDSATEDSRLVWLGVWLFYLTNWVGQDYLAPQALNYFFFLLTLGILLRWFKTATPRPLVWLERVGPAQPLAARLQGWLAPPDRPSVPSQPWQRVGLMALILVLFPVTVSSHQLTPFFTLAAVGALLVLDRLVPRGLPVVMAVMIGVWLSYLAMPFLEGHFSWLTRDIGQVSATVTENVSDRVQGSPEHVFVLYVRIVLTVAVWGLAVAGAMRRVRRGYWDLTVASLAVVPFLVLGFQAYGGEMLLRVYLFALPAMLFFAAALFYTARESGQSWRCSVAACLVSLALFGGFLFARYGNERMDLVTAEEVTAVRQLYGVAEPGAALFVGSWNLPWRAQAYEQYDYVVLDYEDDHVRQVFSTADVDEIAHMLDDRRGYQKRSFLIITRSEKAEVDLFSGLPEGSLDRLEQALKASDTFQVIFSNRDATIFTLSRWANGVQG